MYEDQEYAEIFSTFASELRLRSLVNRASDSGSEGRAFESHRGHRKILDKLLVIKVFFIYISLGSSVCLSLFIKTHICRCHSYTANLSSSELSVLSTYVLILGAEGYLVWIISSIRQLYNPLIFLKRKHWNIRLIYSGLLHIYILYI